MNHLSPKALKAIINTFNNASFVCAGSVVTFDASCFAAEGIAKEVAVCGYRVTRNYSEKDGAFFVDRTDVSEANKNVDYFRGYFQAYTISEEIAFDDSSFRVQTIANVIE
jgi:hypothetical protein